MRGDAPLEIETARLRMRDVAANDLEALHEMFISNPEFLALREELVFSDEGYDLESVRHYWERSLFEPERHLLIAELKTPGRVSPSSTSSIVHRRTGSPGSVSS